MSVTFFDILGIDRSLNNLDRQQRAGAIWPARRIHFLPGDFDTSASVDTLMEYLQNTLVFKSISPGATADMVGFYAEVAVKNLAAPPPVPLVIRTMPDVSFFLQDTGDNKPARCYVTKSDTGMEIIVEALPVEIRLPGGLLEPLTETGGEEPPAPLLNAFVAGIYDSYAITLKTSEPSSIFVHIKVRITEEFDFILEPSVVLSVGPCLFSGLPCFGLHDISLIASPTLEGDHEKVEQAIEWTRHTIEPSESLIPGDSNFRGVLAVRTIDLDSKQTPLRELHEFINSGQAQPDQVQFVLQDVVFPFFNVLLLPVPIHATLGIRRNIEFGDRFEEAYSFAGAPIKIDIAGFLILIEEFIVETIDPDAPEQGQIAKVNITITRGELPKVTTINTAISASDNSITIEDFSVFDDVPLPTAFIIDRTTPSTREIVIVTARNGSRLDVVRGQHNTDPVPHATGTSIELDRFAENAVTIGFTDEWTAQAGWRRNKGIKLFTLGDNTVKLMGAKTGFSFKRLYEQQHGLADYKWYEFLQLLVDLNLEIKPSTSSTFRIEVLSNTFNSSGKSSALTTAIGPADTTITVTDGSVFEGATLPATLILERSNASKREAVTLTTRSGNQLQVVRGQFGTIAVGHERSAAVETDQDAANQGTVNIIWKDIGFSLGSAALGGVQLPEGTQVVLFNFLKIIIQDISVQTDKNGGTYFSITGGLGVSSEKYAASIIVYRFRWRIAGNENAAKWLLDGISFALKINTFEISGTGMAGEFTLNDHLYKEMQFALDLKFRAFAKNFELGLFLYKGEVSGPVDNFKYWMFGFKLAFIPLSGFDLYNIRLLAANNLAPNLPPPDASEQHLRVYKWYKNAVSPLSVSTDRKMSAWIPQEDSFAFGVGTAGAVGGTKAVLLDMFVFGHHSPKENEFMVAMEVYLLKSQKPVGFGVLEVDLERGQWAFFVGISLSFSNVLPQGAVVPGLDNVAALSGNLYLGNQPGTFALGQLSDQNTWLAFRMKEDRFFKMELILGMCMQFVDKEEGPKGFGALISAKGGVKFGVGKAEFYLNFLLIAGIWKNESSASGLVILFEAGFRIKLFRVFRFGASIKVQLDFLGPNPEYKRLAFEIRIDTPWYLPDVTIRFEKIYRAPQPEKQMLVSIPVISAEAFAAGVKQSGPVLLTALDSTTVDEKQLYHLDRLRSLNPMDATQANLNGMAAIGVDSTIVLNFKPPVDDKLTIGENTPAGAGTQGPVAPASSELSITYQLTALSIRRQPRYGPNANQWTTLLAPENTQMPALDEWPSDADLEALFSSEIKVLWDRDVQSQGKYDPRRLLINADTPFTLLTQNAQADESILIYQPGWPCCNGRIKQTWHQVNFAAFASGERVPGFQLFSNSDSTLHWLFALKPLVAPSLSAPGNPQAARINITGTQDFSFAVINFDQPAFHFRMECYWFGMARNASFVLEGYNGVDLLSQQAFPLSVAQSGLLGMNDPRGFTWALLRYVPEQSGIPPGGNSAIIVQPRPQALEIVRLEYRTVLEQRDAIAEPLRCQGGEQTTISGKGKLAWLPNHNYEVTVTTQVILQHNQSGAQQADMVQRAYFRTKGMIGLNYAEHTGKEIAPYLQNTYPTSGNPIIYREEPVAMAFTEKFNILLPVDRTIDPSNSAELNQVLEWDLTVDKQGDPSQHNRISKSSPDWIVSNRGTGNTNPHDFTILISEVLLYTQRKFASTHPLQLRLDSILASPYSCDNGTPPVPPRSQVLIHKAVDPSTAEAVPLWEANTGFIANLKVKGGPCIHRNPFEADDVTAFRPFSEQGFEPGTWIFEDGEIRLAASVTAGTRLYAVFGETDWDHVHALLQLIPDGGATGFAIGVATSASGVGRALLALIDESEGVMKALLWNNGQLQELQQAPIPVNLSAPYQLELTAYDDQLEIKLDDAMLIIDRGEIRSGQLALVGTPGCAFTRLTVEALDAYRFHFQSSRFESFEQHIESAGDNIQVLPAGTAGQDEVQLIADLYMATAGQMTALMQPGGDPVGRTDLFMQWADTLALPLQQKPPALSITRLQQEDDTLLVLFESPEPLKFSTELELTVEKEIAQQDPPVQPGLGNLEQAIPAEFEFFEQNLPPLVEGLRALQIDTQTVHFIILKTLRDNLTEQPQFALTALNHSGNLKYFLFELNFSLTNRFFTRVTATLKDRGSFNRIIARFFLQAVSSRIGEIHRNEVYLLNNGGELLQSFTLPDISMPNYAPQHFRVLSNGEETAAVLIPWSPADVPDIWKPGNYRFHFKLSRKRYEQELPDDNASYDRVKELSFEW